MDLAVHKFSRTLFLEMDLDVHTFSRTLFLEMDLGVHKFSRTLFLEMDLDNGGKDWILDESFHNVRL